MRAYKVCALLILAAPVGLASADTWTEQVSNSNGQLYVVHAVSRDIVWAAGGNAQVVRTTDGGAHWEAHPTPSGSHHALFAFDAETCVVAGFPGLFWRTTNGGTSWDQVHYVDTFINGIHFFDAQHGWAVGDPVGDLWVILETVDGGASWSPSPTAPLSGGLFGLTRSFSWVGTLGVFGTNAFVVWRTTNGGADWTSVTTNVEQVAGLVLSESGIGLAGGDLERLDRSTDGGQTWHAIQSPTPARLLTFDWIAGTDEVWGSTGALGVFHSANAGIDWEHDVLGTSYIGEDLDFADAETGWSVGWTGGSGRIWKYSASTGIADEGSATAGRRVWCHPNPFTTRITVGVEWPGSGPIEAGIYGPCGRRVVLLPEALARSEEFVWDGSDGDGHALPAGVYKPDDLAGRR
jgi:photosystem II stability/assembly factor-like uncharacterized protein